MFIDREALPWRGPCIFFELYSDGPNVIHGEMCIEWESVGHEIAPRLKVWNDGWAALAISDDLLKRLAAINGKNATIDDIAALLTECGFRDTT